MKETIGPVGPSRGVSRTSELCLADGKWVRARGRERFAHRWVAVLVVLLTVAWSPRLVQCQSWESIQAHEGSITAIAISPDGKELATAGDENKIKVWEMATGTLKHTLAGHSDEINSLAFSPSGQWLASAADDKTVRIWDVVVGRELRTLSGHEQVVRSVSFSPDGKWLASGSNDHTVKVWESATGQPVSTLRGHEDSVTSVAFSPDGKWLASAGWDKLIKLWDVATWREKRKLAGHKDFVSVTKPTFGRPGEMVIVFAGIFALAFSPDGQSLASVSNEGTLILWQVANGKKRQTLDTGYVNGSFVARSSLTAVAFSPDGTFVVVGTNEGPLTAKINTIAWWTVLKEATSEGPRTPVLRSVFTFGPDGKLLVGRADGRVTRHDASPDRAREALWGPKQ